ncbi:MAG: hypothetical protein K2I03_05375 [Lachnospiraceae bacterium]|nr:hypothetical protein [Lachnospiraceae bacterium]
MIPLKKLGRGMIKHLREILNAFFEKFIALSAGIATNLPFSKDTPARERRAE